MQRRQFLQRGLGLAGLLGSPLFSAPAFADQTTAQRFAAALAKDSSLGIYANHIGNQQAVAKIEGKWPTALQGSFFRNGPGRTELGGERYHHLFDGDGFAQRWQIQDGKVTHLGRFVETRKFQDESEAGRFLYPTFGTALNRAPLKNSDTVNAANTNLLPFNGSLFALWEGGSATELDPDTLATRGLKTWRPDLKAMPFSAHPKIAPDGSMWNFGALPGSDKLALYRIGADGKVLQFGMLNVPNLAMVHDFVISEKHLIFLLPPYVVKQKPGVSFLDAHIWQGSGPNPQPSRVLVVKRSDLQVRQIFEMPPHMVFHFGNAWEDGDCTRFDVILHDGADILQEMGQIMRGEHGRDQGARNTLVQIKLDYAKAQASSTALLAGSEFPRVVPQVTGLRHRRLAALSGTGQELNQVNLLNLENGRHDAFSFGAGWKAEEHILVPKPGARREEDAWLLGVAQNLQQAQTVLNVFDAAAVNAGPLARAILPYRAPLCFHGNFLPANSA